MRRDVTDLVPIPRVIIIIIIIGSGCRKVEMADRCFRGAKKVSRLRGQ